MGLDYAEMIMSIEESFSISITDEEIPDLETPQDIINNISEKVLITNDPSCNSLRAFNLLRRKLVQDFKVERKKIKTDCSIFELVKIENQREFWFSLKESLSCSSFPTLTFSKPIRYSLYIIEFLLLSVFALQLIIAKSYLGAALLTLILFLVIAATYWRIVEAYGNRIPQKYHTIKKLLPLVEMSPEYRWTKPQVEERVCEIVLEITGFKRDKYKINGHFYHHFNMG